MNWFFSSQIELAKKYAWRHPFDGKSMLRHCKKCVRNIFETKDLSPEYFSRRPWKTFRKYHGQDQDETLGFLPYETPWRLVLIYGKNPPLFASKSWNFYFLFILFILKLETHARFLTNAYVSLSKPIRITKWPHAFGVHQLKSGTDRFLGVCSKGKQMKFDFDRGKFAILRILNQWRYYCPCLK